MSGLCGGMMVVVSNTHASALTTPQLAVSGSLFLPLSKERAKKIKKSYTIYLTNHFDHDTLLT